MGAPVTVNDKVSAFARPASAAYREERINSVLGFDAGIRQAGAMVDTLKTARTPDTADILMRSLAMSQRRGILGRRTRASSFLTGPLAPPSTFLG